MKALKTELQAFGLIVTAEPYFAVSQPSDVVMETFVRKDTVGKVEEIEAKYELLQRGQYSVNVAPAELKPIPLDKDTPLDLHEARNAIRIARWAGADKDASESFQKADKLLQQAEAYKARKAGNKPVDTGQYTLKPAARRPTTQSSCRDDRFGRCDRHPDLCFRIATSMIVRSETA